LLSINKQHNKNRQYMSAARVKSLDHNIKQSHIFSHSLISILPFLFKTIHNDVIGKTIKPFAKSSHKLVVVPYILGPNKHGIWHLHTYKTRSIFEDLQFCFWHYLGFLLHMPLYIPDSSYSYYAMSITAMSIWSQ